MSLKTRYREAIQPKLLKDLNFSNMHQVPKVVKVTVNRGLGEAATNAKALEASLTEIDFPSALDLALYETSTS